MNKNHTLFSALLLAAALTMESQQFEWATTTGNSYLDVVTDSKDRILSTGIFEGTRIFDPGPDQFSLTSQGNVDVVIFKQAPDGKRVWARSIGGAGREFATSIDVDANDRVYAAGWLEDMADMDPGPGTYTLSGSNGQMRGYVLCLSPDGDFAWAGQIESSNSTVVNDLRIKGDQCYVTGWYVGVADFDMGTGTHTLSTVSNANAHAFVAAYNLQGDLQWVIDLGVGIANCIGLYPTGAYIGKDMRNPLFEENTEMTIHNLLDDGTVVWSGKVESSDEISIRSIDADNSGNLVATGWLKGAADFNPGPGTHTHTSTGTFQEDIFVFNWTSSGTFVWSKVIGGEARDQGEEVRIAPDGNIWVAGAFNFTVDFDPSYNDDTLKGRAHSSFLLKLAENGDHIWAGAMYVVLPGVHVTKINGMHVSGDNSVFLCGSHDPEMDADPGPGEYLLPGGGGFMIRLNGSAATGITATEVKSAALIFPSPFVNTFFVDQPRKDARLQLTDTQGRLVHEQTLAPGRSRIEAGLAPGIYIAEIFAEGRTERQKIMSSGSE